MNIERRKMPKCNNECTDKDKIYECGDRSEDGYFRTRSPGHTRVHVAYDINNHEMDVWHNGCNHMIGYAECEDRYWPCYINSSDGEKEFLVDLFKHCPDCGKILEPEKKQESV